MCTMGMSESPMSTGTVLGARSATSSAWRGLPTITGWKRDIGISRAALLVVLRLRLGGGTVRSDRVFRWGEGEKKYFIVPSYLAVSEVVEVVSYV